MRFLAGLCLAALAESAAMGQAVPAPPAFEVASVKLSRRQERVTGSTGLPPVLRGKQDIVTYTHVILKGLLIRAYNVPMSQVAGPSWLDETFYDIVAKAPQGTLAEQVPAMLQSLLAERFRMRVHWDTEQKAGYALVAGKTGPKLKRSDTDPDAASESFGTSGGEIHLEFKGATLEAFARSLAVDLAKPVADRTGIQGVFDIALNCSADSLAGFPRMTASPEAGSGPSIFTAIRDLGLDLVSQTVPVKRLVVDSAERVPTEN